MDYTSDLTQWMTNLPTALQEISLNQLAIPGSHDSGTFDLTLEMAPSAPAAFRFLASLPGFDALFGPTVMDIATCQNLTIRNQLEAGIRFLDFRVSSKDGKQDLYFVHSVYGTKIRDGLSDINNFLTAHPREVVILDIQHFYDMNPTQHTAFISLIKSTFGDKLCPRTSVQNISLKYLWENNKQLICIYQNDAASSEPTMWTSMAIHSPWPNTTSPEECVSKLTGYMNQAQQMPDVFFVCQGVLTPDTSYVVSHCGGNVHKMTKKLDPVFNTWLSESPTHWKHQPNIVIHDFIEEGNYVKNVLALNNHRI